MNLWFRLAFLILSSVFRPKIDPVAETSHLRFRVWPHDLDTSMHLNNGRYWTLMDLGRADLMLRSMGKEPFTWGSENLTDPATARSEYIAALRAADGHEYEALFEFVRS